MWRAAFLIFELMPLQIRPVLLQSYFRPVSFQSRLRKLSREHMKSKMEVLSNWAIESVQLMTRNFLWVLDR